MTVVPGIPFRMHRPPRHLAMWHTPKVVSALTRTLVNCHLHEDYWLAAWHLDRFRRRSRVLENWIRENVPPVMWHDGRVWRTATEEGNLYPLIQALKECPLPIVLVGPWWLNRLSERTGLPVAQHIETRRGVAILDKKSLKKQVRAFGKPAFIGFSVACVSKMLIHELWPLIGQHSFMVDFGAMWDVCCGIKTRPFHRELSEKTIQRNLHGI